MDKTQLQNKIQTLAKGWSGNDCTNIAALPKSGSNRRYFRVWFDEQSIVAAYNPDVRENKAFISFTKHFRAKGLRVPGLLFVSEDETCYFLEDLGDDNLYKIVTTRQQKAFDEQLLTYYKEALSELIRFQLEGHDGLNYQLCYPRPEFDEQSIQWDLNYFKYYYLKLDAVDFNEQLLENDYHRFIELLMGADRNFFMFRDFQSRNIMIKDGQLRFIDYQGGRRGPLQYDVASLLYQAKADIPEPIRESLLDFYLGELQKSINIDKKTFIDQYYAFVLVRTLQVLGAYGYRGFFERKKHFIESIPFAINNLVGILQKLSFLEDMPELKKALYTIIKKHQEKKPFVAKDKLQVTIFSFSFRKGIPEDKSGNGGGFVFDCRAIHNPGRYEQYKTSTGMDQDVIDFFAKEPEMHRFLDDSFRLVDAAVEKYVSRGFSHLQVNFGCTGGQHRSVYSAETLARHLKQNYDVEITLRHREQE